MKVDSYRVNMDAFEGPLDLLLHLVKTNEVDIYHLPLSDITDQYLAYLEMFEELDLDVAGEYLLMAATLMHIKSRLLLPRDDEDEEEEEDPVQDLVGQLAEYQRYREAADTLRDRALIDRDVFRRAASPPPRNEAEDPGFAQVELPDLLEGLRRVLARAAARIPHLVESEEYHVADAVREMLGRLDVVESLTFDELFGDSPTRGLVIATFIGLLELMKMGIIHATQDAGSPEIRVSSTGHDHDDRLYALLDTYGPRAHEKEVDDAEVEKEQQLDG